MAARTAFITGASSGIGRRLAQRLVQNGYRVLATGRREERLQELAAINTDMIQYFAADLNSPTEVERLIGWVLLQCPKGPDLFIHSAGQASLGNIENLPEKAFTDGLQTQVVSFLQMIKGFFPHWRARGEGHAVVISSGVAYRGLPGVSAYCVPKAAQLSLVESLAVEWKPLGIRVTSVSPGLIDSEFRKNAQVYGALPQDFAEDKKQSIDQAVDNILRAIKGSLPHREFSSRGRVARILNSFAPNLLHRLLVKKLPPREAAP